ncbi:MAG: VWA domain-containing protein [Pseudohongiella sp.]|nr:MAG: VWA domain-containing protein [Pseudohongiella sp.]
MSTHGENVQRLDDCGRLVDNIIGFARLLRAAGLPIGPARVIESVDAVSKVAFHRREDLHACLRCVFISRADQLPLFDQAFYLYWQNPKMMDRLMAAMLPGVEVEAKEDDVLSRRLADALLTQPHTNVDGQEAQEIEFDASFSFSDQEVIQEKDFETMSAAELEEAKLAISQLRLPVSAVRTRRYRVDGRGAKIDMRASLRASMRSSRDIPLRFVSRRERPPPLVLLCDISGSMNRYSRMLLHFMHTLSSDRDRVSSFVFATRLTNVSRQLQNKDVDNALDRISASVHDWSGGTRIGACLKEFNKSWSRRVLGQGAVVIIVSDGLDREETSELEEQMARLKRSAKRIIWLNPLLRYAGFQPKAAGIKAMLPFVDEFISSHNVNSLREFTALLSAGR